MRRIIWFTFADVWASFSPAAFASVGLALAIAATRAVLVGDVPTPAALAVEVVTGALALALCVRFCPVPAVWHELRLRLAAAGLLGTAGGLRWRLAPLILGRPEQEHREHVPKRSVMLDLTDASDRAYLKPDVHGLERRVLAGAGRTLESVHLLEVELSLVKLYEDGPMLADMLAYLEDLRFEPIWFERAFSDAGTGRLLRLDSIFAGSQR
jgi:hypothetical protein